MSKTITGTYSGPVQVQFPGNNPFSFAGTIIVGSYTALAFQPGTGTNWTVTNSGRIEGRGGAYGSGAFGGLVFGSNIQAVTSGTLTNSAGGYIYGNTVGVMVYGGSASITNLAGATIAARLSAVDASGGMTVTNAGLVTSQHIGIQEIQGGGVTNLSGGTIAAYSIGVRLVGASTLTNQSGGTISGNYSGVRQYYGVGLNAGVITGGSFGVYQRTADFTNQSGGLITGGGIGVRIGTGSLVNQANATISATRSGGTGVSIATIGTITNSGLVQAASGTAVFEASGLITNTSTGTIAGNTGIRLGSGTLVNAGLVSGTTTAFQFNSNSATNRVVLQPGGTFSGAVKGGGSGVLELASAAAKGTIGNLASFTGFASMQVDAGASWVMNGANTVAAGVTLSNAGTVTGPLTLLGGNTLDNSGTLIGSSGTAATFGTGGNNTVLLRPGASISGALIGGAGVVNTAHLVSGGPGYLYNFQNVFTGFNRMQVDNGAHWTLTGSLAAGMTMANYGTVSGLVYANTGALITNAAGATLTSDQIVIVYAKSGPATVVNAGRIAGASSGFSVVMAQGGTVSNAASGVITGRGILMDGASALVTNSGTIQTTGASSDGVRLRGGGIVSNAAGASITGSRYGVFLLAGGTVSNAGTIGGSSGSAVYFSGTNASRLIVNPGAVFSGKATFSAGAISTLELAGTSNATLSGVGTNFVNVDTLQVDSFAHWTLTGGLANTGPVTLAANASLHVNGAVAAGETIVLNGTGASLTLDTPDSMAGTVADLGSGESLDLHGVDPNSVTYSSGRLHFGAGHSFALSLSSGTHVQAVSDGAGGATVSLLCFCAGTLIATPRGEVPVQELAIGDLVTTLNGTPRPITWVGEGRVLATRGRRNAATPVIVRRHALGPNVPNRDLRLTKGHALYLHGVLIPVEELINHRSILWDDRAQEVAIYHVELATHDVLLANGAPAESYRDDGNRWLFGNANAGWGRPPEPPCAPIHTEGALVDTVWRDVLDRAGPRPRVQLTNDADLHLLVDGKRVDGRADPDGTHVFPRASNPRSVRIASRAAVPAELGLARDARPLGVAVRQIRLWRGSRLTVVDAGDPGLEDGFHSYEAGNGWRWTDGDAGLPAGLMVQITPGCALELAIGCTTRFPCFVETHRRTCA